NPLWKYSAHIFPDKNPARKYERAIWLRRNSGYYVAVGVGCVNTRCAPYACRIGSMDCRTQGCYLFVFLFCGAYCVCTIPKGSEIKKLAVGGVFIWLLFDG